MHTFFTSLAVAARGCSPITRPTFGRTRFLRGRRPYMGKTSRGGVAFIFLRVIPGMRKRARGLKVSIGRRTRTYLSE